MKIPVENIYYLLCYAWNKLDERNHVSVDSTKFKDLVNLFAKVLINGLNYLRKRGMDRGYQDLCEDTAIIRGKINFNTTIKNNLLLKAKAHCEYDSLNYNVLHNRIIKSTIAYLVKAENLHDTLKHELIDILFWFPEVEYIDLTPSNFHRVQLNRNNTFYGFLLNICELLAEQLIVEEKKGTTRFKDFTDDIQKMRKLYELFVLNFYDIEQTVYNVDSPKIKWHGEPQDKESSDALFSMQTDITLTSKDSTIIIDTKYTPHILQQSYMGERDRIRTGHLYQIFSYVINAQKSWGVANPIRGILLYPAVEEDVNLIYEFSGHQMEIRTINLAQPWQDIHNDLLALVGLNEENRFN